MVGASRATRNREVGTSNAYYTIWLADAARGTGGRVVSLELDSAKVALARGNLIRAGLADRVEIRPGRAVDTLSTLSGPFDFVFLDANRPEYLTYLELVLPKLEPGGLLVADNVVSHAAELRDYLTRVKSDARLFSVTVPIGNGEEISLKLG
jgi:predicted O-methyltransferase YrrM